MSRRQRKKNSIDKKSNSQHRSGRKGLWWKVTLGVFALLIAGVIFAYSKAIAFLHSEEFKQDVALQVGAEIGSKVTFGDFKWSGMSAKNDSFQAAGDGAIASINATDLALDVEMDFFKRDKFSLANVKIGRVDTVIDLRKDFLKLEIEKKEKGFIEKLLPDEVELLDAVLNDINATIHTDSGDYTISGLRLEAKKEDNSYNAMIEEGEVNLPYAFLKSARLKQGDLVQFDNEIYVKNTQFEIFDSGVITLNGVIDLSPRAKYLYDMEGKLSGLKCKDVFPDEWHRHLEGEVLGKFKIKPHQGTEPLIVGNLEIKDGTLQALPILNQVSYYLAETRYRTLMFQSFQCEFEKFRQQTHLRNIVLKSTGLIQVEGDLKIDGVNLDGLFNVGVPSAYLDNIPGAKTSIFQPGKDGLLWTQVKIGGDFDNISEDLSNRLIAAATDEMIRRALQMGGEAFSPEAIEKILKMSGEGVNPETLKLLEGAGKEGFKNLNDVIKGDKSLIEGGVDTAKGLLEGITGTKPEKDEEEEEDEKMEIPKMEIPKKDGGLIPEIDKLLPFL